MECDLGHVGGGYMWKYILKAWLGFIYPPKCILCKMSLPQEPGLCLACQTKTGCTLSPVLEKMTINDLEIYALNTFNDAIRQLVHGLKYREKTLAGRILGCALGHGLEGQLNHVEKWVVIPVPLHGARKRERGYNQSAIIAHALGNALGICVFENALKRVKNTASQTKLDRQARYQNVATAFVVNNRKWRDFQKVILVDDVVTTGATVDACVKVLIREGVQQVVVAAVAHPSLEEDDLQQEGVRER